MNYIREPELTFGFGQKTADPRDGLILFGPHEKFESYQVKAGVIGTKSGIESYLSFVETLSKPIYSIKKVYGKVKSNEIQRPSFPGFETVFGIKWPKQPEIQIEINETELKAKIAIGTKKQRTSDLVDLYLQKIVDATSKEDIDINLWFIVVPRELYVACKPKSWGRDLSKGTENFIRSTKAGQVAMDFEEYPDYLETIAKVVDSSTDFHHLLKARLLIEKIKTPVQIYVEPTLKFRDKMMNKPLGEDMKAHVAWTTSTTVYYKLGKSPWKLNDVRDGVCYLGLVFKKLQHSGNKNSACSAAQMFLKDGDGSVFRGNIGAWQGKNDKDFHLDSSSSEQLLGMALDDYKEKWKKYPVEIFIHGRANFTSDEWGGFTTALSKRQASTKLVGIVIKDSYDLKMFRSAENQPCNYGVMRGLSFIVSEREAYLYTRGFIPRLNTASSLEIPNPLHVRISRGDANIKEVLSDILALTKLNYNACIYGDGLPVTLRFSDNIGNILTATDNMKSDMRQFKYYI
ncbi:MAG: hypothetical protein JNL60_13565 [Bacteroidia bacterium]|nr:hypothetical protein [Bacteroidia bacterium]